MVVGLYRGATTFSKLGVQFLGLGYYYPSTEKIDRSTQFGAVGYTITLYSSKKFVKSWGSVQIFGRSGFPRPPVVAPMGLYIVYALVNSDSMQVKTTNLSLKCNQFIYYENAKLNYSIVVSLCGSGNSRNNFRNLTWEIQN